MFSKKFGEKLAEGLAAQWAAQKLGPALVFWAGGLLAWHGSWQSIEKWLQGINNTATYVALAAGGLLLAAVSGTAVQWLQPKAIRWLEGYWPRPLHGLRFYLSERLKDKLEPKEERWGELAEKVRQREEQPETPEGRITAREHAEYVRLDSLLNRYPVDDILYMPTTLGNLMRSAEEYPKVRYGLDAVVCWPRMWLLMPDKTLEALSEAREELNSGSRLMIWSILFLIWAFWTKWAALSLLLVPVAYWKMLGAAETYGYLIRSAFDIHRFKLYESLHWPLPPDPAQEEDRGKELTKYLFRGIAPDGIVYNAPNILVAALACAPALARIV